MRLRWPFVLRETFDAVKTENYTLRDALRNANDELRKHRQLIGGIREGSIDVVRTLDRMAAQK